jgi:membrane protease YdiL (CAAX protease family)
MVMSETDPCFSSEQTPSESSPTSTPKRKPQAERLKRFVRKCYVGPSGIRAGWRLSIYLLIVIALFTGLILLARASHRTRPNSSSLEPRSLLSDELVSFAVVLFASWVMSRIEHRRIADYGLPLRRAFRGQFWQGAVIGFLAITALLVCMWLAGVFRFGTIGLHGFEFFAYAILWGAAFLFVGLFEESFFRGYALFTLTTGMTFWPSAVLLSAFFGLIHHGNAGENWVGSLEAGVTGLLFCLLLRRTGDLWMAIGFHGAWDWGETFFYGVPDSGFPAKGHLFSPTFAGPVWLTGGGAGPEGSWLCIALLSILWIVFSLWLREKKYPNPALIRFQSDNTARKFSDG